MVTNVLADSTSKSLCIAYAKYKAAIAAAGVYETIVAEGRWPSHYHRVTVTEIRQIFVSKTVWHGQYVPCFQDIDRHEDMLAWLESSADSDPDAAAAYNVAVWGERKSGYHFADLKAWLEKKKKKVKKAKAKKVVKKTDEKVTKKKK